MKIHIIGIITNNETILIKSWNCSREKQCAVLNYLKNINNNNNDKNLILLDKTSYLGFIKNLQIQYQKINDLIYFCAADLNSNEIMLENVILLIQNMCASLISNGVENFKTTTVTQEQLKHTRGKLAVCVDEIISQGYLINSKVQDIEKIIKMKPLKT